MPGNISSISHASSYEDVGEYWDTQDLADHWEETYEVNFEVSSTAPSVGTPTMTKTIAHRHPESP